MQIVYNVLSGLAFLFLFVMWGRSSYPNLFTKFVWAVLTVMSVICIVKG